MGTVMLRSAGAYYVYTMYVHIWFQVKFFNLLYFLRLLALLIHELELGNKGNWESTWIKSKLA